MAGAAGAAVRIRIYGKQLHAEDCSRLSMRVTQRVARRVNVRSTRDPELRAS